MSAFSISAALREDSPTLGMSPVMGRLKPIFNESAAHAALPNIATAPITMPHFFIPSNLLAKKVFFLSTLIFSYTTS